eukprot:scaffold78525_cov63-Phaeocystis_antarctica.AAC.3
MHALNEAACEVSKLFRDSAGRAERDKARDAAKALRQVSEEVTQGYTRKKWIADYPEKAVAVKLARDARTLGGVCSAQGPLGFHRH